MVPSKRRLDPRQPTKFKKRKTKPVAEGSGDDVLLWEVKSILGAPDATEDQKPGVALSDAAGVSFSRFDEIEVNIQQLSSSGDYS